MGNNFLFNNTLQCFGDAAKQRALLPMVGCVLGAIVPAAHADTMNAPASQVAAVDSSVALREEMLKIIPAVAMGDYAKLSPEGKQTLAFFYQGFKGKNTDVPKGLDAMICLLSAMEANNVAVATMMKPNQKTSLGLDPVSRSVRTLAQIFPETDNSPYSAEFKKRREEAEKTYAQGKELQAALDRNDPEAVVIAKRNLAENLKIFEESRSALAASREERTVTRVELAKAKKKNHSLRETEQQMDALAAAAKR